MPAPTPTATVPKPVSLPADEAPHNALTEWWYYTGHLKTTSGREYGFEFVIFQAVRAGSPVGYAAHFAVTDLGRGTFTYQERSDRSLAIQGNGQYRLSVGGWQMEGNGDDHHLLARGDRYAIDLRLHSVKPPMLHNGIGWISLPEYVSVGTVFLDGFPLRDSREEGLPIDGLVFLIGHDCLLGYRGSVRTVGGEPFSSYCILRRTHLLQTRQGPGCNRKGA
jgi:hypothetical protein